MNNYNINDNDSDIDIDMNIYQNYTDVPSCNINICDSPFICCKVCNIKQCLNHLVLKLSLKLNFIENIDINVININNINDNNIDYVCLDCLVHICESCDIFMEYIKSIQRNNYLDNDARLNINLLKQTSDYKWRICCVDRFIDKFVEIQFDLEKWNECINDINWIHDGKEDFLKLIKEWTEKGLKDKFFCILFQGNVLYVFRELNILILFILNKIGNIRSDFVHNLNKYQNVSIIKYNKQLFKNMKIVRKKLSLFIKEEIIASKYDRLRIFYQIEKNQMYCQCIVETLNSHLGRLFTKFNTSIEEENFETNVQTHLLLPIQLGDV